MSSREPVREDKPLGCQQCGCTDVGEYTPSGWEIKFQDWRLFAWWVCENPDCRARIKKMYSFEPVYERRNIGGLVMGSRNPRPYELTPEEVA